MTQISAILSLSSLSGNACSSGSAASAQCMFHSAYALVTLVAASLSMIFPAPRTVTDDPAITSRVPSRGSSRGPVTPMADGGASGPAQGGAGGRRGRRTLRGERGTEGPLGERARGPASTRGNNDVQQSGPLSVWVAEDGAGQGGAGRAGTRRGGGMGGGPGPGLDGWDRAEMGLLG